jgi:hypothetical protein
MTRCKKAVTYFENNKDRMDYDNYRRNGYQIGSGTIESAAKHIGLLCMKLLGVNWNLESARHCFWQKSQALCFETRTFYRPCRAYIKAAPKNFGAAAFKNYSRQSDSD